MKSRTLEPVRIYCVAVALVGAGPLVVPSRPRRATFDRHYAKIEFLALAAA